MTREEAIEARTKYNVEILFELIKYLEKYPEIRFGQALVNLNIIETENDPNTLDGIRYKDFYNDEPVMIYNRMKKS